MYEDYLQDYWGYPINGYTNNTYDQNLDDYQNGYNVNRSSFEYGFYSYPQNMHYQKRGISINEMEELYPETYKIIYPMVKKVCANNNRTISNEVIEDMTQDVYSNLENNSVELNITLNNEVRGEKNIKAESTQENRGNRNNGLMDMIKILILRELIDRPCKSPNCRPGPGPRPPYPPYPPRPPFVR